MGYAMAANIRQKISSSSTLYINDINAGVCDRFKAQYSTHSPIKIVCTAGEAAEHAKVRISIVPRVQDVRKVYLDAESGVIMAKEEP
jgi:3-hydroxyisobutyrate dehydrogenase-like beta-hydroxyacid dehydrogenase